MNNLASSRLFFALPLQLDFAQSLLDTVKLRSSDPFAGFHSANDLHLTIHFLGSVPNEQVPGICSAAREVCVQSSPFIVDLTKLEFFSGKKRCLMVALSRLAMPLATLYRNFNQAMQDCGMAVERRTFRPHVTLLQKARDVTLKSGQLNMSFDVNQIILFQSQASDSNSRYKALEHFDLI